MQNFLAIFIGGGAGAVVRYITGILMLRSLSVNLPISTFLVNVVGSFIIGFLYILFVNKPEINPALKFALTVGFCGGLTTFSTFSLELFEMIGSQRFIQAFTYILISVAVCLLSVTLGACLCKNLIN